MENHLETYLSTALQRLEKAAQEILRTSAAALKKEASPKVESLQEKKHEDPRSSNRQAG